MFVKNLAAKSGLSMGLVGTLAYRLSRQIYHAMNNEKTPRIHGKFTKKGTKLNYLLSSQKLKQARGKRKLNSFLCTKKETKRYTVCNILLNQITHFYADKIYIVHDIPNKQLVKVLITECYFNDLLQLDEQNTQKPISSRVKPIMGSRVIDLDVITNELKPCHSCG